MDATGAMSSSEQTVLSSAVSGMLAVMATKWHRPADCSIHGPQPPKTHVLGSYAQYVLTVTAAPALRVRAAVG